MNRRKTIVCLATAVVLTAVAALGLIIYSGIKKKLAPSTTVKPLSEYYNVASDEVMIILDEKVYDKTGLWRNGKAYLDMESVRKMYSKRFFCTDEDELVIFTTSTENYHFYPGNAEYTINGISQTGAAPVIEKKGEELYVELSFLEQLGITYYLYTEPNRLLITYDHEEYFGAEVVTATQIRTDHDIKADIVKELVPGDKVRIIDGGGIRENGFVKVMSSDGVRGYAKSKDLTEEDYVMPVFRDYISDAYLHNRLSEKVYLGWQLLYKRDSVSMLEAAMAKAPEMNVISPTWFYLSDTEGGFVSYANEEYVKKAHANGVQVWALYKNDTIEGMFSCTEDSHKVLSSTESREKLEDRMIEEALKYDIDGINIDFELLKLDTGVYFIQFLRELSIKCREQGLILSVDNYVPENYNAYYDLAEQGTILDYVIIMGYDQHYAGSEEAGSVSALDWFTRAIDGTLAKADAEAVIMAVPFYTRLWKETGSGSDFKVIVEANMNMDEAEKKVTAVKAEKQWKEAEGQYYAEYTSGNAKFRIWLEDFTSIGLKTDAVKERKCAGIAAWKLGDEAAGTWSVIKEHFE